MTRTSVGVYFVDLPGMPHGGATLVTPTGIGRAHRIVASIRTERTPQRFGVRCFSTTGGPADARSRGRI